MRRRIGFVCSAIAFVALIARATGCTSSSNSSGPADCVAGGGHCQIPNLQCAKVGPQDCNPYPPTTGGQYCCLAENPAPTCALGAACSPRDDCSGGIAGCGSNCQCLNGTWQAPCPTDLPQTGGACMPEGAYCGYATFTNACGAENCDCKGGAWSCGPSCAIGPAIEDGGVDASGFPSPCVEAGPVPNCTDADIEAKNYDQSCQTNSDCVLVGEGESCFPCSLAYGPYGAISRSDLAKFEADVVKTPAGNLPVSCAPSCTRSPSACCLGGKCQVGSQCSNPTPTDAGPDTGASDAAPDGGPLDAGGG